MTVAKLLTGRDMPLSRLEMMLMETYQIAKRRFEQQNRSGKRR